MNFHTRFITEFAIGKTNRSMSPRFGAKLVSNPHLYILFNIKFTK